MTCAKVTTDFIKIKSAMTAKFPSKIRSLALFDGQFDAHKLVADGCDVLFASYPAGTKIAAHRHDTDNHGVITRGAILLTAEGRTRRYAVGEWYHVAAQVEHAAEFEEETDEIEFWFSAEQS